MADRYFLPLVYRWEDELLPALEVISGQLDLLAIAFGAKRESSEPQYKPVACIVCFATATCMYSGRPVCQKHFDALSGKGK